MFEMTEKEKDFIAWVAEKVINSIDPKLKCAELWITRWNLIMKMHFCKNYPIYEQRNELILKYIKEIKDIKRKKMVEFLKQWKERQLSDWRYWTNVILSIEKVEWLSWQDTILTIAKEYLTHEWTRNLWKYDDFFSLFASDYPDLCQNILETLPFKSDNV